MKHSLSRVLALVVTLSISMGSAAMFTGNDLLQACADKDDAHMFPQCLAYIRGAHDGHDVISALYKQDSYYCLPDNVTLGQTGKVVSKYLENHPEELHEAAIVLVYGALMRAFPCEDDQ